MSEKSIVLAKAFHAAFAAANTFGDASKGIISVLKDAEKELGEGFALWTAKLTFMAMVHTKTYDDRNEIAIKTCRRLLNQLTDKDFEYAQNLRDVYANYEQLITPRYRGTLGKVVPDGELGIKMVNKLFDKIGDDVMGAAALFAFSVCIEHRTLQQTFTSACLKLLYEEDEHFTAENGEKPWSLPLI